MATNGETETKCSTTSAQLSKQRVEVLVRTINNLLGLDPKPEIKKSGKSEKRSFQVSAYIRKIDSLIDRIDALCQTEVLDDDALEKIELYRGRLEERAAELSMHIDYEDKLDDSASYELAVQRRELLMDDVDNFLRIPALNVPTNRRQALIDKGDRYIERLENLGYFHLQDPEVLKQIRASKRDITKQINELCRGSDGTGARGNNTWASDNTLNEQRMEILFRDIEQFVNISPNNIPASRRSATVQKGDKLIEKLLQYGYYQVLEKEKLEKIQKMKLSLEKNINDLSKMLDEQPNQSQNMPSGGFAFRRQHSTGYERNY